MQQRTLVRARGLAAFRQALGDLAIAGGLPAVRRRLVLVPTRAAAELLRQTIEQRTWAGGQIAIAVPDIVTREEWLGRLHAALPGTGPLLTRIAREVLLERAARETLALRRLTEPPFQLRPGLVATMLDFHDELRRRQRSVRRFVRALFQELRVERGTDRGSEGLVAQTIFLASAFLAYERGVTRSGAADEHLLRRALIEQQPQLPFDELILAVADHPADPGGLWPADFDLAGRLSRLQRLTVVITDEAHDAGFRDRIERELPGIEEQRAADVPRAPVLVVPDDDDTGESLVFISRDREEEVRDVARTIRQRASASDGTLAAPSAVVFHRPLPYLYLAQQVLSDARIPFQAFDALPLAAEPYAALLDLVLAFARTGGTAETTTALMRSTLLAIEVEGERVGRRDVTALDRLLRERRVTGDASTYPAEVDASPSMHGIDPARARRAAAAAAAIAGELAGFREAPSASAQIRTIATFLRRHERLPAGQDESVERHRRARAAVLTVLDDLASACARHDDQPRAHDELTARIHHALEQRTFTPRRGNGGVHLVDSSAARFGEFADVYLVGLVDTDWSDRQRRSVFYSSGLLAALGWPQDTDQALAQQAAFLDVLTLARDRTRLSAFQLEGDAAVGLSPLVDHARNLPVEPAPMPPRGDVFPDEVMTGASMPIGLDAETSAWLEARRRRPPISDRAYGGFVAPRAPEIYRVSRVDRYVSCPFKYFSEFVLRLPEEREDSTGPTPLERGTLMHSLFERFYDRWQHAGRGAITTDTLPEAIAWFEEIAEEALAGLPEADQLVERMRLLGSIVTRGIAERVFELEAAAGIEVRRRLLEYKIEGAFTFPLRHGLLTRTAELKGKADRIDELADGSLRVVDYKLGRMPDVKTSVQAAVYAYCARQRLEQEDGRPHPVASAAYLAFGDDRRLEGRVGGAGPQADIAVQARAADFATTLERIEAGEFPPRPLRVGDCQWCGFAGVCRKEYRIDDDDDEAADAV